MKTGFLIIAAIIIAVTVILALTVKTKPYDDYPGNHVEELKQIPEVGMFYEKYGDRGVSVFSDGAYSYQIGFQSGTSQDQWIMLKINYHFGILTNIIVHCTPNSIQSQYTITDNVLEYLSEGNCFDAASERLSHDDDFEETFGGPGNRHPAFLGYEIPESCTEDMVKHLVRYSNMFFADDEEYFIEGIGLPENVNPDNYDICVDELLKLREIREGNRDDVSIKEFAEPSPPPTSTQCKPGLPPWTSNFYLDKERCEWKLIPEPIISEAIPYVWNAHLQKRQIDFSPQERSYVNTDEGYFPEKETRVCSPLILSDGTELYISSTFTVEPFMIIDTIMSETQPPDCHKIWKTDKLLVEPSPELGAWLDNYFGGLENEN